MRFGKKQEAAAPETTEPEVVAHEPRDAADVDAIDTSQYIDLGSLLIPVREGLDVQLQVDDATGQVIAAIAVIGGGAIEVRAFAAGRGVDLWAESWPEIIADAGARGGSAEVAEGPWGTELACVLPVQAEDGSVVGHPSRVVGFNGPRWMLRAAFMGEAAVDADRRDPWQDLFCGIIVRRGTHAVPPGEPLALTLPAQARRVEANGG